MGSSTTFGTFDRIADAVSRILDELDALCNPAEIRTLKALFDSKNESPNYDHFAYAFARAFFLPNYWKMMAVLNQNPPVLPRVVLDAGCGSGAATLALLAAVESYLDHSRTHFEIQIFFVDQSIAQLSLAKKIFQILGPQFNWVRFRPIFVCLDLGQISAMTQGPDCFLLSHVLTENNSRVNLFLGEAVAVLNERGKLFIVERIDDPVWQKVYSAANQFMLPLNSGVIVLPVVNSETDRAAWVSVPIQTRYLMLKGAYFKGFPALVQRYFLAWTQQSLDLLKEIFSADAEYSEKPFSVPFRGLKEICEYWREKVLTQHLPQARVLDIVYSGHDAFLEWEASHGKPGENINIRGVMIMTIDEVTGKISRLREYFRTQAT